MKINRLLFAVIIVQILFITSCSDKKVLPEDKFVNIYSELIFAQDTSTSLYAKQNFKTIILKRFNVPEKMYDSTVAYYNSDPQKWSGFFDKVTKHVEDLRKQKKG